MLMGLWIGLRWQKKIIEHTNGLFTPLCSWFLTAFTCMDHSLNSCSHISSSQSINTSLVIDKLILQVCTTQAIFSSEPCPLYKTNLIFGPYFQYKKLVLYTDMYGNCGYWNVQSCGNVYCCPTSCQGLSNVFDPREGRLGGWGQSLPI